MLPYSEIRVPLLDKSFKLFASLLFQIVDDLFAFARATVMPYTRIFNILAYLKFEDDYAPWLAAITGFNFAIRRLAHDNDQRTKLNVSELSLFQKKLGIVQ